MLLITGLLTIEIKDLEEVFVKVSKYGSWSLHFKQHEHYIEEILYPRSKDKAVKTYKEIKHVYDIVKNSFNSGVKELTI